MNPVERVRDWLVTAAPGTRITGKNSRSVYEVDAHNRLQRISGGVSTMTAMINPISNYTITLPQEATVPENPHIKVRSVVGNRKLTLHQADDSSVAVSIDDPTVGIRRLYITPEDALTIATWIQGEVKPKSATQVLHEQMDAAKVGSTVWDGSPGTTYIKLPDGWHFMNPQGKISAWAHPSSSFGEAYRIKQTL